MRFLLAFILCIWSISVHAERVDPAILEYINCRNTSYQNALKPLPPAPEWMRQSNLKCGDIGIFNIDSAKLTMNEFNSHWRNSGGPELLESTFAELEGMSFEMGFPKELISKFEQHTAGSLLSNLIGITASYEQIYKSLSAVDLFSSDEAAAILVLSRSERFISNNQLLLEVMLKRHFGQTGRMEIPPVLEMVLLHHPKPWSRLTLYPLPKSTAYVRFILAAHELIEEKANEEIARLKTSITDINRITFLCPDLLDYTAFTYPNHTLVFPNGRDFNASSDCSEWYEEMVTEANIKLEGVRRAYILKQKLLKAPIVERIK